MSQWRAIARAGVVISAVFATSLAPLALAQETAAASRTPDVVFVPTPMEAVNAMLAVTRVGKNDVVYDLGCGDGRIVITAADRFGARGVGIDIDPQRIADSRRNADSAGVTRRATFRQADLFETDLRPADVVTLYLLPALNVRLRPKLFDELRPGTRVASHDFDMGDWKADSVMEVTTSTSGPSTVYYWVIPAKAGGNWVLTAADERYTLELKQQYQQLSGTAEAGGRTFQVENARLLGDKIRFTLADGSAKLRFEGRVKDGEMAGTMAGGAKRKGLREWRAAPTTR